MKTELVIKLDIHYEVEHWKTGTITEGSFYHRVCADDLDLACLHDELKEPLTKHLQQRFCIIASGYSIEEAQITKCLIKTATRRRRHND